MVTLVVMARSKIQADRVNHQPFVVWDFLPTLTEIAGVPAPEGIDDSILPALLGGKQVEYTFLYWEFHARGFEQATGLGSTEGGTHGLDQAG